LTANNVLPGPIRQISYIVRDIDDTIQTWLAHGVGPWFILPNVRQRGCTFRGQPAESLLKLAFANSGELQIELVQQLDDTPSSYREFLDTGSEGFHHLSFWADDFDAAQHAATQQPQWQLVQRGDARSAYYDTGGVTSTIIEISEMTDRWRWITDTIRDAAATWDGQTDPIRTLPPRPGW
jgi:Glyoxalase/Bleomycin resistance protein/Dioxygenase superfamily